MVVACGSEGYSLSVSEHSSDASADPPNNSIFAPALVVVEHFHVG